MTAPLRAVNPPLTPNRTRSIESYAGFVRRAIRAHGRRVADADPEDLADLLALRQVVEEAIAEAVEGLRAEPRSASWAEIGRGAGITRQAAQQAFGPRQPPRPVDEGPTLLDLIAQ